MEVSSSWHNKGGVILFYAGTDSSCSRADRRSNQRGNPASFRWHMDAGRRWGPAQRRERRGGNPGRGRDRLGADGWRWRAHVANPRKLWLIQDEAPGGALHR